MKYMSIFRLDRFKESKQKGGVQNMPAKITLNPQGGRVFTPYFGDYVFKMKTQSKKEGGHAGWGFTGPHAFVKNPQGGIKAYPFFGPHIQAVVKLYADKYKKREAKGGSKGGSKSTKSKVTRQPKPAKPHKGKPVHAKLHANPHPILAECCGKVLGKTIKQREADSGSMVPLMTVKGTKKESTFKIMSSRFREAKVQDKTPTKFRVVLLEEGMGNSHDVYYYTKEALESAVDIFTGLKIMADHPTAEEENIRPERSTRDILGHYENLAVEEGDNGQHWLCGDVDILPSEDCAWARARMVRAIENAEKFPGRDFIGLSINASGPSEKTPIQDVIDIAPEGAKPKLIEAQNNGVEIVKLVKQINRAVSCDLVTEAGAGGKILNIIEEKNDGQKAG